MVVAELVEAACEVSLVAHKKLHDREPWEREFELSESLFRLAGAARAILSTSEPSDLDARLGAIFRRHNALVGRV